MKRRFFVAVSGLSAEEQERFLEFVRGKGMGWWHWISECWLLTDPKQTVTAAEIRDFLHQLSGIQRCLVMEVEPEKSWAGLGPNSPPQEMFKWIKETWKKES